MAWKNSKADVLSGLVTALRTLTALPIPGREAAAMSAALPWFPMAGLSLGLLLYVLAASLSEIMDGRWPSGVAVVVVIAGVLLTRGLHLDGLADWADGFWGSRERDRTLVIMKDSSIGTFGAVAVFCVLLAKWAGVAALISRGGAAWLMAALMIARTMQVWLAVAHPYARPAGGTAAAFVNGATRRHLRAALASCVVLLLAVGRLDLTWLVALALAIAVTWAFGRRCRRRVGGVTGDLLGACSELTEALVLLFGAALHV
jgi:adenosylcobinamide-GDP ribazoletransferase